MDGWNRYYPPDVIPALWEQLDRLAGTGTIICPDEVLREIARKDDALHKWVKKRPRLFYPLDDPTQVAAAEVLAAFPKLVDTRRNRSVADPFVVATGRLRFATVVTGEKAVGTAERPRIPNVCAHFNVRSINMLDFIREQGWVFQLAAG